MSQAESSIVDSQITSVLIMGWPALSATSDRMAHCVQGRGRGYGHRGCWN
jgi:hypothetical protein